MNYLLAGDVGGTKTLLRLLSLGGEPVYTKRYLGKDFANLEAMIQQFVIEGATHVETSINIQSACLGIAGPVANNAAYLTNLGWKIDGKELGSNLGIAAAVLINDFTAIGYGVLGLNDKDLFVFQQGEPELNSPIAIIGAGTGLGEGYLTWQGSRYQVHPSEGGHSDFAPRSEIEIALLQYLLKKFKRVSVERVVSGQGIVNIYQFLLEYHAPKSESELQKLNTDRENGDTTIDLAAKISQAALDKTDALAIETIELFLSAYAGEVGNLALKVLPYGGIYIAGGILAKLMAVLEPEQFLQAIKNKGRVSPLFDRMPICAVLNAEVGLIGAGLYGQTVS